MVEKFYQNKKTLLETSQNLFQKNSNLVPKIGIELEFFLLEKDSPKPANTDLVNEFITELQTDFLQKFPLIIAAEKEQGASQIEIKTRFTSDLARLCEEIDSTKIFISELAKAKNLQASFAGKPIIDDCGNALQLNISLHDSSDKNIFENEEENDEALENMAAKLLAHTNEMMIFLSPNAEDYSRFSPQLNSQLFKQGKNIAPTNLSFGNDNRSCAIRVPSIKAPFICPEDHRDYKFDYSKRLEYRVPSASADSWLAIATALLAMSSNSNDEKSFQKIYGNAFEPQYQRLGQSSPICKNITEAEEFFNNANNSIRIALENFL